MAGKVIIDAHGPVGRRRVQPLVDGGGVERAHRIVGQRGGIAQIGGGRVGGKAGVAIPFAPDARIHPQTIGDVPGVIGVKGDHARIGLGIGQRSAIAQHTILRNIAQHRAACRIGDQIERARLTGDFDQHVLIDGEIGVAVERAVEPGAQVMAAQRGVEFARDAQVALNRVEFRFHRAILARHDKAGGGGGVIDTLAIGARNRIAHAGDRAKGGLRGGQIAVGKGGGVGRVGGGVKGIKAALTLRRAEFGRDQPAPEIALIIKPGIEKAHMAAIGQIARQALRLAHAIAIFDHHIAQRGRVHRAAEIVDIGVKRDGRIARIGHRNRQIEQVMVIHIHDRGLDIAIVEVMLDIGADLAAAIAGKAAVAIAVMLAQKAADGVIGPISQRAGLHRIKAIEAGVAQRDLRLACRLRLAGDGDRVGDGGGGAGIDRRGAAAHDFHALAHQVIAVHALARVEEHAVNFVIERQAILLKDQIAAISGNAAHAGDVLNLAAGGLDMDTGHGAEQVGEILGRDFGNVVLAQRVDRIGHVKTAFSAGGTGHDDIGGRVLRLSGRSGCILGPRLCGKAQHQPHGKHGNPIGNTHLISPLLIRQFN